MPGRPTSKASAIKAKRKAAAERKAKAAAARAVMNVRCRKGWGRVKARLAEMRGHNGHDAGLALAAEKLGITRQAVAGWDRVPGPHVLTLARMTGISPSDQRPDLYEDPEAPLPSTS